MNRISLVLVLFIGAVPLFAQVEEARQAIERGEYVRAVNILSAQLADQPAADAYLLLGIAYRHEKEYQKSEDVLREGSNRYPNDTRFYLELANVFLENKDIEAARTELRRTLAADPNNNEASDQLATIDMSEGDVQAALRAWNKTNRPFIADILHNYYLTFGSWVVRDAVAFRPSGTLRYDQWKTSESRLFETENFSNVGLEIEPTRIPDQYNAVVRTTRKTNTLNDFAFNFLKGAIVETSYVDVWDIRKTGINFNGAYRWDTNRRRAEGQFKIPLPFAGLMSLEIGNTWRAERWNVSENLQLAGRQTRFDYKANAMRVRLKSIPHYRVEVAAGFEYRNRAARGDLPEIYTDSRNTGKLTVETDLHLADGKYQNRLHLEAFGARRSIIGDSQFTGGVAELKNRLTLSKDSRTYLDWAFKGGTARGALPVEDYFVLGLGSKPLNLLRGHTAADHGKYGFGPTGTDYVLFNSDIERRLATIPFFNNLNIPLFAVKWEAFFDSAKTWDRTHVFKGSKFLFDTGGGLRFEAPAYSLNLVYGRSLRDGRNVFYGYVEKRFW